MEFQARQGLELWLALVPSRNVVSKPTSTSPATLIFLVLNGELFTGSRTEAELEATARDRDVQQAQFEVTEQVCDRWLQRTVAGFQSDGQKKPSSRLKPLTVPDDHRPSITPIVRGLAILASRCATASRARPRIFPERGFPCAGRCGKRVRSPCRNAVRRWARSRSGDTGRTAAKC